MASNVESALPQEVFELQLQLGETYERDRAAMAVQGKVRNRCERSGARLIEAISSLTRRCLERWAMFLLSN